jgi:hypothetical protein
MSTCCSVELDAGRVIAMAGATRDGAERSTMRNRPQLDQKAKGGPVTFAEFGSQESFVTCLCEVAQETDGVGFRKFTLSQLPLPPAISLQRPRYFSDMIWWCLICSLSSTFRLLRGVTESLSESLQQGCRDFDDLFGLPRHA